MKYNIIAIDTETTGGTGEQKFVLGVVFSNTGKKVIREQEELTKSIIANCRFRDKRESIKNIVMAHNWHFDGFFIDISYIAKNGFILSGISLKPFFIRFERKTNKRKDEILFIDSSSFFKTSLEEIGKFLGLPKLTPESGLETYCSRDAEIVYKIGCFIAEMVKKYGLRTFPVSASQMAMQIFKKICKHNIIPTRIPEVMKLERDGYFGGRTEVFRYGHHENVRIYDVNSMYPFTMKVNRFPTRLHKYYSREVCASMSLTEKRQIIDEAIWSEHCVMVRAQVVESRKIPIVPLRTKTHTIFPQKKETVISTPEYRLVRNDITEIYEIAIYDSEYIFEEFVTEFYELRQGSSGILKQFYKLILNSLYGKFGQRKFITEIRLLEEDDEEYTEYDDVTGETVHYRRWGPYLFAQTTGELNPRSFVAVAAHVTAYARCYLWEHITEDVLYCDTDSIFTIGRVNNIGDELGQWKEEYFGPVTILGTKFYLTEREKKIRGIPKRHTVVNGGFEFLIFSRAASWLKSKRLTIEKCVRRPKTPVLKRSVNPDLSTVPFLEEPTTDGVEYVEELIKKTMGEVLSPPISPN